MPSPLVVRSLPLRRDRRNASQIRILKMLARLGDQRLTVAELAKEFHVSIETVRRDIRSLREAGVMVYRTLDDDRSFSEPARWGLKDTA